MTEVSKLPLTTLKRKAEKHFKGFKSGKKESITFLFSNHPRFKDYLISKAQILKPTRTDFLHAVALKNGYKSWESLRSARIEYIKPLIRMDEYNGVENSSYEHISTIKKINSVLTDQIINTLPAISKQVLSDLKTRCLISIDHYNLITVDKETVLLESDNRTNSKYYTFFFLKKAYEVEKVAISLSMIKNYIEDNFSNDIFVTVGRYYSSIMHYPCSKENFKALSKIEKDPLFLKYLNEILEDLNKPRVTKYKYCPVCNTPNEISASECLSCNISFI